MNNLIVSLSENILRVSLEGKQYLATTKEIPTNIVNDSVILDKQAFAKELADTISELTNVKPNKLSLNFLIEPQDTVLKFVTASKKGGDLDEQILNEIKDKLDGGSVEDYYYSYQKIAPFFYQFVAVKKEHLETIIEISNMLSIPLTSAISWLVLLPKYLNKSEPAIFLNKTGKNYMIALSELNGVYFREIYESDKVEDEIHELIKGLATYKRTNHIKKVYTINDIELSLDKDFEIIPLYFAPDNVDAHNGFDFHFLVRNSINSAVDVVSGQSNLLNLLPVPAIVENKSKLPAVVMTVLAIALLGGGGFGAYKYFGGKNNKPDNTQIAVNTDNQPAVLSDTKESTQSSPAVKTDLNKSDIRIRVENGTQTAGLASKARDFLSDKGFVIASIGNASDDYDTTQVLVKESKKDYGPFLVESLKPDYQAVVGEPLDADEDYDVLVIVGSK